MGFRRSAAAGPSGCQHCLRRTLAVEIGDSDGGAVLGQPLGRRRADATSAAGNQRDASFRTSGHVVACVDL
jgi:hypothetical protein